MNDLTLFPGETGTSRNVAHRGPAFGPWHRQSLIELERRLQSIDTASPPLTIPYWRWDAELTTWQNARIWTLIGGNGDSTQGWRVTTGPFADWTSVIWNGATGTFSSRAGILRQFSSSAISWLAPTQANYDVSPWSESSDGSRSFRQGLEGWGHNSVHERIGGDMGAGTAPNDPVFWLHHANTDRLWARWQQANGITNYQPTSGGPPGHNLNDVLRHLESTTTTPASVLDWTSMGYTYDALG
jgi:tyrosinase